MITRAFSVCFEGIEPQLVEIECAISSGLPAFSIIGPPDIAASEARDCRLRIVRTRAAGHAICEY